MKAKVITSLESQSVSKYKFLLLLFIYVFSIGCENLEVQQVNIPELRISGKDVCRVTRSITYHGQESVVDKKFLVDLHVDLAFQICTKQVIGAG